MARLQQGADPGGASGKALSREAMKSLVQKLPKAEQRRLLALHAEVS